MHLPTSQCSLLVFISLIHEVLPSSLTVILCSLAAEPRGSDLCRWSLTEQLRPTVYPVDRATNLMASVWKRLWASSFQFRRRISSVKDLERWRCMGFNVSPVFCMSTSSHRPSFPYLRNSSDHSLCTDSRRSAVWSVWNYSWHSTRQKCTSSVAWTMGVAYCECVCILP